MSQILYEFIEKANALFNGDQSDSRAISDKFDKLDREIVAIDFDKKDKNAAHFVRLGLVRGKRAYKQMERDEVIASYMKAQGVNSIRQAERELKTQR